MTRSLRARSCFWSCAIGISLTSCLGTPSTRLDAQLTPRPPHRALDPIAIDPPDRDETPKNKADPTSLMDQALLHELRSAVVLSGARSVGATSIVLKVPLDGGAFAAFKPDTHKHRDRWRAEVAAWRLANALRLQGVPPSVPRAVKMSTWMASITSEAARKKLSQQAVVHDEVDADGEHAQLLDGAMIAWLPHLRPLPLESEPMRTAWGEWLAQTPPSRTIADHVSDADARALDAARPLAAQISSMIVFDTLTGNRDRWSGANVMVDETGTRLVFLDNNLAFDATTDRKQTKRRAHVLARVERFSRALIAAVRDLRRADLERIFSVDHEGAPLLQAEQIDAVMARREELLAHVDRLVATYGEERVLCFD